MINKRLNNQSVFIIFIYFLLTLNNESLTSMLSACHAKEAHFHPNNTENLKDVSDNCVELAKDGKCASDVDFMIDHCAKTCKEWQRAQLKFVTVPTKDNGIHFFDLSAKKVTGDQLKFDQFEGYVTLVMNIPKICSAESKVTTDDILSQIEHLQSIWPYALQIIVFPFEPPGVDYSTMDCSAFHETLTKWSSNDVKIHVMDVANLEGPNVHEVYKYFRNQVLGDHPISTIFYFILNPDASVIHMHFEKSIKDMITVVGILMDNYSEL